MDNWLVAIIASIVTFIGGIVATILTYKTSSHKEDREDVKLIIQSLRDENERIRNDYVSIKKELQVLENKFDKFQEERIELLSKIEAQKIELETLKQTP